MEDGIAGNVAGGAPVEREAEMHPLVVFELPSGDDGEPVCAHKLAEIFLSRFELKGGRRRSYRGMTG